MLIPVFAAAILSTSVTTAPASRACPDGNQLHFAAAAPAARAQMLGELPPANHVLTVYREVDRCPAPVIVRYGIGSESEGR